MRGVLTGSLAISPRAKFTEQRDKNTQKTDFFNKKHGVFKKYIYGKKYF